MSDLRQLDDGTLRAYLDGELDAELMQQIEAAARTDEVLQVRLDEFRQLDVLIDAALEPVQPIAAEPPANLASNRGWWLVAAAVLLSVGLLAVLAGTRPDPAQSGDARADASHSIEIGERVVATPSSRVDLRWRTEDDGATVVTQPMSAVFYRVEHGTPFTVETPLGSATVTGTCFTLEYGTMKEFTKRHGPGALAGTMAGAVLMLTVHEGSVVLANDEGTVEVTAGQHAHVAGAAAPKRGRPSLPAGDSGELARLRASEASARAEVARLEKALAKAEASRDDGTPTEEERVRTCAQSTGRPECSTVEPDPAVLERRAQCGTVVADMPRFVLRSRPTNLPVFANSPPLSLDPSDEFVELVGLTDAERTKLRRANEAFAATVAKQLEALAREVPDLELPEPSADDPARYIGGLVTTLHAVANTEEAAEVRRRVAEERAGWSSPPSLRGASVTERFVRHRADLGEAYEDAVAEHLGASRARELRLAQDGWGYSSLWGGSCPGDDESE